MKYIFITYLPGAAGNFFSRCLNLLSNAYCYGQKNNLPTTLEQKLKMLSYESVFDRSPESIEYNSSWVEFEGKLTPYYRIIAHHALPPESYSIWSDHMIKNANQLHGPDDQIFNFYIDPGNSFEWACMNALYKNSYLDVKWFIHGKKLSTDAAVYKISLDNFLVDWDCFLLEFLKVTDIIGHTISEPEIQAVKILYDQWRTTILERNDIETFKKNIGFFDE
jgi:hypothetical protein